MITDKVFHSTMVRLFGRTVHWSDKDVFVRLAYGQSGRQKPNCVLSLVGLFKAC